jgi:hypothetical protein
VLSTGASGGTIITWKSSRFIGRVISCNEFAMSVEFSCTLSDAAWILECTNIYTPCTTEGKMEFSNRFHDFTMPDDTDWLVAGDYNLIRKPSDRNKQTRW